MVFPTQNRIDAIGTSDGFYNDLKIYEKGKYHPWVFDCFGKFRHQASYNEYSKMDEQFVKKCYELNSLNKNRFVIQKKDEE